MDIDKELKARFNDRPVVPDWSDPHAKVLSLLKAFDLPDQGTLSDNIDLLSMVLQSSLATQAKSNEFEWYLTLDPLVLVALSDLPPGFVSDPLEFKLDFLKFHRELEVGDWANHHLADLQNLCLLLSLYYPT